MNEERLSGELHMAMNTVTISIDEYDVLVRDSVLLGMIHCSALSARYPSDIEDTVRLTMRVAGRSEPQEDGGAK